MIVKIHLHRHNNCTLTSSDVDMTSVIAVEGVPGEPFSIADVLVVNLAHCFHEVSLLTVKVRFVHLFLQTRQVLVKFGPAISALWVMAVKETLCLVEWNARPWHSHEREHHSTVCRKGDVFCLILACIAPAVLQVHFAGDC